MSVITVGPIKAIGSEFLKRLRLILIWNTSWWMAVLCVFINTVRQKKHQEEQAMGKSRGGLSTKIHAAVDALGNPVRFILTAGQCSEIKQADALIEGYNADYVIADKGYDADSFVLAIESSHAIAVIPPRRNRNTAREYDAYLYQERNLVERVFQKLKNYRRIATRYERLAITYQAMLCLVATVIWLN
jgi:transposase